MKANELRIGNWVNGDDGPQNVAYLGETIGLWNSIGGTAKYQHNPILSHDIDNLKPIPLTPEILEKSGFVFYNNPNNTPSRIYKKDSDFRLCKFYNQNHFILWNYPYGKAIRYLHQLQNLYYALTGEELNIDL